MQLHRCSGNEAQLMEDQALVAQHEDEHIQDGFLFWPGRLEVFHVLRTMAWYKPALA